MSTTYGEAVYRQFTNKELEINEDYPHAFDAALEPWKAADPDHHWYQVHRDDEYANSNGPQWRVRMLEDGMQTLVWGTRVEWVTSAIRAHVTAYLAAHEHDHYDQPTVWRDDDDD